jgi:hypothetical protein
MEVWKDGSDKVAFPCGAKSDSECGASRQTLKGVSRDNSAKIVYQSGLRGVEREGSDKARGDWRDNSNN